MPSDLETGMHDAAAAIQRPQRPLMPPRNVSSATLVEEFGAPSAATLVDENPFFSLAGLAEKGKESKDAASSDNTAASIPPSSDTAASTPPDSDTAAFVPPDGGLVAWCQVAAGALLNAIAWGTGYVFGIYQLYYTQTLGMDASAVSWVGSLQTFLTYFVSTISGLLADAGYARHVVVAGTLLVLAGGIGTSFSIPAVSDVSAESGVVDVPAALFVCQAVVTGTGLGLLTTPALTSINAFFSKRRSLALAVATLGTGLGGTALPAVVQYLLPAVGFGWSVRCSTLLSVVACAHAALLLRTPPQPSSPSSPSPPPSAAPRKEKASRLAAIGAQMVDWSALRELPYVLFMASSFLLYWGLYFGYYYINTYAEAVVGFSANRATLLLIMTNALGLPSRVLAGAIADRAGGGGGAGPLDTLVVATVLQGTTLLGWLAVGRSVAGMYLFVVFFGLCNGATQSVWVGAIAALSKHAGHRFGARFGMVCVVAAVATLAGAPTASALIGDASLAVPASYHTAMIWAAATTLASAVVMAGVRIRFVGWRLRAQ